MKTNRFTLLVTLLSLTALALGLTACHTPKGNEAVPSSEITVAKPDGTKLTFRLPKDESIEQLTWNKTSPSGTNEHLEVKGLKAENKEAVIAASWAGVMQAMQAQNERQWQWIQAYMFSANKAGNYFGLPTTPTPTNAVK